MNKPLLSMLCITYNQKKYISKTLDGFLMQKTKFPFEILIHDDASTDGTTEIIKEYAKKHPKIFRTIFEKENQYSKGNITVFLENMYKSANGKYIAWCEGDDYWTDPNKAQLQVDLLEKNPNYSICFHPVKVIYEDNEEQNHIFPKYKNQEFNIKKLLEANFIQTNSVMYRKQKYSTIPKGIMPVDWYMHLYHAQFGKIGFINKTMACYIRQDSGIWADSYKNKEVFWQKHSLSYLNLYHQLLKMYGSEKEYKDIIFTHFSNLITESSKSTNKELIGLVLTKYLNDTVELLKITFDRVQKQEKDILQKDKDIVNLQDTIKYLESDIRKIKKSYTWRLNSRVQAIRKKLEKGK